MFYFENIKQSFHTEGIRTRSKSREYTKAFINKRRIDDQVRDYIADPATLLSMVGLTLD